MGLAVLSGCGSDSATSPSDTTVADAEAPATVTVPVDFRSAMVSRLGDEWGDPAMAEAVVTAIGADAVAAWEAKVPLDEVATTPLLDYTTPGVASDQVDAVAVFTFGNRTAPDGTITPGPTNQDLADVTAAFVAEHPVPVYAQMEVAQLLAAEGVPGVTSIDPTTDAEGKPIYLSTRGVADAIVATGGTGLGRVGFICFSDHLGRCLLNGRAAGMDAVAIGGVELPSTYDPQSGQAHTRDRMAYLTADLAARGLL